MISCLKRKKENPLFTDNVILYVEKSKEFTKYYYKYKQLQKGQRIQDKYTKINCVSLCDRLTF